MCLAFVALVGPKKDILTVSKPCRSGILACHVPWDNVSNSEQSATQLDHSLRES